MIHLFRLKGIWISLLGRNICACLLKPQKGENFMRIVQINTFPNKSTGSIMLNIHRLLSEAGHDSYVVWGRGRKAENDHEYVMDDDFGVKLHGVYTRLTDKTGFASKRATKKLISKLEEINPDLIHLHNIHGYYINIPLLFDYIKKKGIKVVWTLHDCWAFTGHCANFDMCACEKWKTGCSNCIQSKVYPATFLVDNSSWNWDKKKNLFNGAEVIIVTPSNWLKRLVEKSFLSDYETRVIYNGVDRNIFKPNKSDAIRVKYHLDERPIILGVASEWTKQKGLDDIIALASSMPEYQFVVVGLSKRQKKKMPENVNGIERTENVNELAALYSFASIFFNPTYGDNFPTTNIEALSCGTPILTYDTGGSPEAVISSNVGRVIKKVSSAAINIEEVKAHINEMMESFYSYKPRPIAEEKKEYSENSIVLNKEDSVRKNCRDASAYFDKDQRLAEYLLVYENV